jgi:hypothetical protein
LNPRRSRIARTSFVKSKFSIVLHK